MNKTAIKNFAIWARRKLISDITYKAGIIGINEKSIEKPLPISTNNVQFFDIGTGKPTEISNHEIEQRNALIKRIKEKESTSDYKTAFQFVIEEVAYTWFNRLIAIRFMEVNDYLPSRIRVLSSETKGKSEPDMVTTPFDTDMDFSPYEKDRIMQLKDENKLDELFRMLFIKQCNKLNEVLPELFEETSDYTEFLLNISFTDKDGIVSHLVNDIDEADFTEAVEIIGWMYQYYISERHDEIVNPLNGRAIKKDDIPAATQIFTTDWVVKYMVDNSLGRYWIERNPQSKLREKLKYFIIPQNGQVQYLSDKVSPEKLAFFDPCMGSGHILVYAFDILMEIYRECGFIDKDAAQAIIENNLFGLDIDNRAFQLAYFTVMMKARSYDRRFLTRAIEPNVIAINETNNISKFTCDGITNDKDQNKIGEYLINAYKHAKELGSLISINKNDYTSFIEYLSNCSLSGQLTLESDHWFRVVMPEMKKLAKQASIMSARYTVVCTNPPYMNKLEGQLKKFVIEEYKPYSGDLFSVFMYRNFNYCQEDGYSAFMTPNVWMSIKTYEPLRNYILSTKDLLSLIQMAHGSFNQDACVDVCTFVLSNKKTENKGIYIKLSDFKGDMEVQREKFIAANESDQCDYKFYANAIDLTLVPGSPITAYCASEKMLRIYERAVVLNSLAEPKQGIATSDNKLFLRYWYEIEDNKLFLDCTSHDEALLSKAKWFPYNKGGNFRRWYGNNDYVIDWENDGFKLKNFKGAVLRNPSYYFRECISWSLISSYTIAFRYKPIGHLFDVAGMSCFSSTDIPIKYLLALNNSCLIGRFMLMLAPTINYQVGNIANIPVIYCKEKSDLICKIADENIEITKEDWDNFETSWDFYINPLIRLKDNNNLISYIYDIYKTTANKQFDTLKCNEEYLNKVFLEIYDLEGEVPTTVSRRDISTTYVYENKEEMPGDIKESYYVKTRQDIVKDFISYAVGCMFGRYSLDVDGLAYAGGEWNNSKYTTFIPDEDNCIPITDEEYFKDDIVGLFVSFVKKVYGVETLEENLDFIAKALGNKGNTSREIIRNYFIKDFYKDHLKIYQKRPIYWLYDSGKQDGFKALIYMHRYNADTTGIVRVDYLHKMQKIYASEIDRMQDMAESSTDNREIIKAEKRKEKLVKQFKETKEYDEKIAHIALSRIDIDLDDGVKVNYEKIQTGQDGKEFNILQKI